MASPGTLSVPAHAKLNLCLGVGPAQPALLGGAPNPRAGWHPICSWMAAIDLADELTLEALPAGGEAPSGGCALTITWADGAPRPTPIDWPIERDLAFRAHAALAAHTRQHLPVRAVLRKRTPTGAGLGGGSADAGAMLVGLNQLFGLGLSVAELTPIAQSLGSDVAFFLRPDHSVAPGQQLVESFGEVRRPLSGVPGEVVLFFPPFGCETRAVYRAFDARHRGPADALPDAGRDRVLRAHEASVASGRIDAGLLFNDLFAPACDVEPALSSLASTLAEQCGLAVHLSGSGSTLFALTPTPAEARRAHQAAQALGLGSLAARVM